MRLALSTTALGRALACGDLTQLELMDLCAADFGTDGIVLDVAHFPRRDAEYVAQVKKFAADAALTIVAVRDDALTCAASDALDLAAGLGAPYVLTRMPDAGLDPVTRYNEALANLVRAAAEAKRVNVTIAVRNVASSLASDAFELTRLRKEADSAWLRFALDLVALGGDADARIRKHAVLAYHALDLAGQDGGDPHAPLILERLGRFAGFLCLDAARSEREPGAVRRSLHAWRRLLARHELQAYDELAAAEAPEGEPCTGT
jgi:sugar phosphate isomerase/epimerase